MSQLNQSNLNTKQSTDMGTIKPGFAIKPFLKLSVEWKILFALLALMGIRLATIIAFVLKQL